MKYLASLFAVMIAAGGAQAAEFKTACTRGGEERLIEIIAPGAVGRTCDVRYTRDAGSNVKVPYHADNTAGFCTQKANDLVRELKDAGFSCASVDAPAVAQTAATADQLAAAEPPQTSDDIVIDVQRPAEKQAMNTAGEAIATPAPQIKAGPVLADAAEETSGGTDALSAQMNEILSQPAQHASVGAPANLTEGVPETVQGGKSSSVVGRIVGAEPVIPVASPAISPAVTPVTQAAMEEETAAPTAPEPQTVEAPAPTEPAVVATETAANVPQSPEPVEKAIQPAKVASIETAAPEKTERPKLIRKPEDIVRATLNAQMAAWNDGDLDAFMDFYWKDDDLQFISGAEVAKGWSATMKRYRDEYADGNGLGQLGLGKLDVNLVTNDVAIVTGRFKHVKDGQSSSGLFSLVMRQDKGVWRIVHDHTNTDLKSDQ